MANTIKSRFGFEEFRSGEPSLDDLFAEPIVKMVMERDHVSAHDMRQQLDRMLVDTAA
jgi:hypothetical protein